MNIVHRKINASTAEKNRKFRASTRRRVLLLLLLLLLWHFSACLSGCASLLSSFVGRVCRWNKTESWARRNYMHEWHQWKNPLAGNFFFFSSNTTRRIVARIWSNFLIAPSFAKIKQAVVQTWNFFLSTTVVLSTNFTLLSAKTSPMRNSNCENRKLRRFGMYLFFHPSILIFRAYARVRC